LEEVVAAELQAVRDASSPEALNSACSALSRKKRQWKREATIRAFDESTLCAPREDKRKSAGLKPLCIDGIMTYSPEAWKLEFVRLHGNVINDPLNTVDIQNSRLRYLSGLAEGTPKLEVPMFIVREVLSAASRKSHTASGLDGVTWHALSTLGERAITTLRYLIECRLNSEHGHDNLVPEWSEIILNLIPKNAHPLSSADWRPIAVTSVLQKVHLRVCSALLRW
jgi:hypothetical protein